MQFIKIISFFIIFIANDVLAGNLLWPIQCKPGDSICHQRIGYPDTDGDGRAFNCEQAGYTGHQGTDIPLTSWDAMDAGVPVFAAEDGEVIWTFDGKYDRCPNSNEPDCQAPPNNLMQAGLSSGYRVCTGASLCNNGGYGCFYCFDGGNVVVIKHSPASGIFATRYDHFKKWSITVTPGQKVVKGQKIGEVGSAGHSTGPHLHFEVWGSDFYDLADPWAGKCGPNFNNSLWKNSPPWSSEVKYQLTVTVIGSGVIESTPPGISCGMGKNNCSAEYLANTQVTLNAVPGAGFVFDGWRENGTAAFRKAP